MSKGNENKPGSVIADKTRTAQLRREGSLEGPALANIVAGRKEGTTVEDFRRRVVAACEAKEEASVATRA